MLAAEREPNISKETADLERSKFIMESVNKVNCGEAMA
jgi:hypothetical protein